MPSVASTESSCEPQAVARPLLSPLGASKTELRLRVRLYRSVPRWLLGLGLGLCTYVIAFALRMLEWPTWGDVEFQLNGEMLLSTHDAYHWLAGAEGFEFGTGHPMSELLRLLSGVTGFPAADVAFWLPPSMASLVAVLVFGWAWAMGSMEAGVCAGILASLAPGFLARTLMGYADTDLVVLFLPLLIGLAPACFVMRFLPHPLALVLKCLRRPVPLTLQPIRSLDHSGYGSHGSRAEDACGLRWTLCLALSGLLGWWGQEWHSLFPYLIRFNAMLLCGMALVLARRDERTQTMLASLAYVFPTLMGVPGLIVPLLLCVCACPAIERAPLGAFVCRWLRHPVVVSLLVLGALACLADASIIAKMLDHMQGYIKRTGDPSSVAALDPLIFPSVAQSIIEIQDLSFEEMLLYVHPWPFVALFGGVGFCLVLCARSGALFLVPLFVLGVLSSKLGGRMVMFGAPIMALGLTLPIDWLACALGDVRAKTLRRITFVVLIVVFVALCLEPGGVTLTYLFWSELGGLRVLMLACVGLMIFIGMGRHRGWSSAVRLDLLGPHLVYRMAAVMLVLCLVVPPLAALVPAMSHGPIINRRHADGLDSIRYTTPPESMLWIWWDWGYAAHYFARRSAIADGAAHGGPSLFLPAAVFATDDPRFARQVIKYTAEHDNVPGKVFAGMGAAEAAALMERLKNPATPLVEAQGTQYIVVSFDMLDLGFWITTFGSWDFVQKEGRGNAISIVPQQLAYRLDKGEVVMQGTTTAIPAATIDLFEDGRLVHKNYLAPPESFTSSAAAKAWRDEAERRRNVHFLFNRVTGEKLVVDDRMYNTLMVRLLIGPPTAPNVKPYFRLIFDNVFCRVYEVL